MPGDQQLHALAQHQRVAHTFAVAVTRIHQGLQQILAGRFAESARFVRHYPEQNPVLRDLLPSITTPTQIVAGRHDELVPWSNNQYLDDLLPNSEIHPLDAGHFAWEQAAEEYGRLVVDWVSGGHQRVRAG